MNRNLLCLPLLLALITSCTSPEAPSTESGGSTPEGAIVHLFEWRWDDVARECEDFLAPHGYAAVQVSPPAENHIIVGRPWFERYQPVSYQLQTRSGDRAAFANMVARCDAVGVDIVVDVIVNHMADADLRHDGDLVFTAKGTAGTEFGPLEYPGLYTREDFHQCALTENNDIWDWNDVDQLRTCELVDLSDLATESEHVRQTVGAYLADLASLGVKGFRVDAAKHVLPEDITAMLSYVPEEVWVVQEVATGGQYVDWMKEYEAVGDLTEFSYTEAMGDMLRNRTWSDFAPEGWFWTSREYIPSDRAMVFVDNHDRQRGHGGEAAINYKDGALYELAQVATLAWPYGAKRVMSSFSFGTDSQGPPMDADEAIKPVHSPDGLNCGQGEWVCEHRWPVIAGAVAFHQQVRGVQEVSNWWTDGENVIAFGRQDQGFVLINGAEAALDGTWQTSLAPGAYCNRLAGAACEVVRVDGEGKITTQLPAISALAIDTGWLQE
ncbi:MAG: alpha-amylase [Rhodothermales bacterium]